MKKLIAAIPNILNVQIIDKNGAQCGKVDDIELEIQGKTGKITAILVGANAWHERGGEKGLFRHFILTKISPQKEIVTIPIKKVLAIFPYVKLSVGQDELGVRDSEDIVGNWLKRIPGA